MKRALIFVVLLSAFTAIGSVKMLSAVPYVVITSVIAVTILIALKKIDTRLYPIYIFGLALSLVWQTSMIGTYIVGVDIHTEYFVVRHALSYGGWDIDWRNMSNSSVILSLLTPALAKIGFDPIWQFKILSPFVCAFTPVVLYFAFKKVFGETRAYFSSLFFMTMPMFTMEAMSMVKSQWAYLFVALMILCLVSKLKTWQKVLGIIGASIGISLSHYTVSIIIVIYLIGMLLVLAITNWGKLKGIMGERLLPVRYFAIVVVCASMCFWGYFTVVGEGSMIGQVVSVFRGVAVDISQIDLMIKSPESLGVTNSANVTTPKVVASANVTALPKLATTVNAEESARKLTEALAPSARSVRTNTYLDRQPPLIRAAIGLDFNLVSVWGKVFRILQYLTELMLVWGFVVLFRKRKEYNLSAEYVAGVVCSFVLLACTIFLPYFTLMTVTTTRTYAITLFFISPLLIIGIEDIVKRIAR